MRELKFRAIIPNAELAKEPGSEIKPFITVYFTLKDLFCGGGDSDIGSYEQKMLTLWMYYGGNIPDQYTGFKLQNDTEIYEGDIIECDPEYYPRVGFIKWDDGYFKYKISWVDSEIEYDLTDFYKNVKVIGNICENPELLHLNKKVKK